VKLIYFAGILGLILLFPPRARCATGACVSGDCQNGTGKFVYADGSWLEGGFKDGKANGAVAYHAAGGFEYRGSYKNGVRSGQGTTTWPDGDYFTGNFENDQREGFGTFYHKDGKIVQQGRYSQGKFVEPESSSANAAAVKASAPPRRRPRLKRQARMGM